MLRTPCPPGCDARSRLRESRGGQPGQPPSGAAFRRPSWRRGSRCHSHPETGPHRHHPPEQAFPGRPDASAARGRARTGPHRHHPPGQAVRPRGAEEQDRLLQDRLLRQGLPGLPAAALHRRLRHGLRPRLPPLKHLCDRDLREAPPLRPPRLGDLRRPGPRGPRRAGRRPGARPGGHRLRHGRGHGRVRPGDAVPRQAPRVRGARGR
mmetsp:Transcript_31064/g.92265  ORF Transcript_31064/g.92265 Transcript_31064/m.92265 type:complete len:208 (-) Transcript_31064:97-720(-)